MFVTRLGMHILDMDDARQFILFLIIDFGEHQSRGARMFQRFVFHFAKSCEF